MVAQFTREYIEKKSLTEKGQLLDPSLALLSCPVSRILLLWLLDFNGQINI